MRIGRCRLLAVVAPVGLVLAACGGGSGGGGGGGGHTTTYGAGPNGSGAATLARAETALGRLRSVRVTTTLTVAGEAGSRSVADIALPGRVAATFVSGDQHSSIRLVGAAAYLRADAAYWQAASATAAAAAQLADRWYAIQLAAAPGAGALRPLVSAETIGRCTLGLRGATTTAPVRQGDRLILTQRVAGPPPTTDRIILQGRSPWLPIAVTRRGPNVSDPTCGVTGGGTRIDGGTVRFGRYNAPLNVTAPAGARPQGMLKQLLPALR